MRSWTMAAARGLPGGAVPSFGRVEVAGQAGEEPEAVVRGFLRGTGDSLLLIGLLHGVFNRTNNPNGLVAALVDGEMRGLAALAAAAALIAGTAVLIRD